MSRVKRETLLLGCGRRWGAVVVCLSVFCFLPSAFSQVPLQFTYQGRLTDSNGVPVAATVPGVFKIVKGGTAMDTNSGEVVHSETTAVTPDTSGVFLHVLGTNTANPVKLEAVADGTASNRFLAVSIGGKELLPRQRLLSVPYAITSESGNPPGAIIAYGGVSAPAGWLLCDGARVSRTVYPRLYAAIGTGFGWGSNNGTDFNLPDLRGHFLRGVSGGSSQDPDRTGRVSLNPGGNAGNAVGSYQEQATRKNGLGISEVPHTHLQNLSHYAFGNTSPLGSANRGTMGSSTGNASGNADAGIVANTTGIALTAGDNETRPRNVNVNYIIKY